MFATAIFSRIYQYIFHKDLWLDEAMLAFSMFGADFGALFFAPLPNTQSAPLLFLVLSKIIGAFGNYNEYSLYFLPFVCGILTLILSLKIAQILFGKNTFGFAVFIVCVCGSLGLLHYSTEFKQYGIEAFVGFLLFYLYLKNISLHKFSAISAICVLLSHTGIFVAFGILLGRVKFSKHFKANKALFLAVAILAAIFLIYYFAYIRFQAVSNFYDYWREWFIPHNLAEIPAFGIKILRVWSGWTPFDKGFVIPLYMIISAFGMWSMWRKRRDIFMICAWMMIIYIGLSVAHIYPFGHDGIIGGRLSLFMSVFFYVALSFGAEFLMGRLWKIRFCVYFALILLIILSFYRNAQIFISSRHHIQQTHSFITQIAEEFAESSGKKCIFIYEASRHAFLYYSHIDKTNLPFSTFGADLEDLMNAKSCDKSWILASHYPSDDFEEKMALALKDKNAKFKKAKSGWGVILGRF